MVKHIMLKRIIIGLLMVAYVITGVWLGRTVMLVHMALLLLIGTHEMLDSLISGGAKLVRWVYYLYAAVLLPAYLYGGDAGLMTAVLVGMLVAMSLVCLRTEPETQQLLSAVLPVFYPALPIMAMSMLVCNDGPFWRMMIWLLFALAASSDTMALFFGKFFGKRKLIPRVSPNKTVEGAIGGVITCLAGTCLLAFVYCWLCGIIWKEYLTVSYPRLLLLALLGSVLSMIGDLSASLIKRQRGVKDYGSLMPGHGGVVDRFDSVFFTLPFVFLFMQLCPILR